MERGGEPLETYFLVPLAKHKANKQKLKRAEEITASKMSTPPPQPIPIEKVEKEEEEEEEEQPIPVEVPQPSSPLPQVGINQSQTYRKNQIKNILQHLKTRPGAESILQLENLDDLIHMLCHKAAEPYPTKNNFIVFCLTQACPH